MIDEVVEQIRDTLSHHGVDYQGIIDEFGQVRAYEDRRQGKQFSKNDHVRGLVLSQLSNQRPWGPIAANLHQLEQIFSNFDAEVLKEAKPGELTSRVLAIRCGNRKLSAQMDALSANIKVFEEIAREFGSMDAFVTSMDACKVAQELGGGKRYKLKEIGFTLAMEYLRNVGIHAVKPDLHICRLIGPERFGFMDRVPTPEEAYLCFMKLEEQSAQNAVYLDNLLWIFASKDYGNLCSANPKCNQCGVSLCARHPSRKPLQGGVV